MIILPSLSMIRNLLRRSREFRSAIFILECNITAQNSLNRKYFIAEYATVGYMAKRIQMRKQRFTAVQKMAAEKKMQIDGPPGTSEPMPPPRTSTLTRPPPPSRSSV